MNTFSTNSLKILDKSLEDFERKYIFKLDFFGTKNEAAKRGEALHSIIFYYLSGFDTKKIETALLNEEKELFEKFKKHFEAKKEILKLEETFLTKENYNGLTFYLTGRFDAVFKENDEIVIYDWKSKNVPKNAKDDLQTVVYLMCAKEIFNSENVSICYFALENEEKLKIKYDPKADYLRVIGEIVQKLPKKYLK